MSINMLKLKIKYDQSKIKVYYDVIHLKMSLINESGAKNIFNTFYVVNERM